MTGFSAHRRSTEPEWMDAAVQDPADYAACLRDLATVNTATLARLPTLGFMARAVRRAEGRPLRVLDVACGGGDTLRRLSRWARRGGHRLHLVGLDLSAPGVAAARAATADPAIEYVVGDVFADPPLAGTIDVVLSSLFTHHLVDADVIRFLRWMEDTAALGWFVNDLHRHPVAFHGFRALSGLARWHPMVRHDGPVSVARAFRRADWQGLLHRAGLDGAASLRWHPPFRWCVERLR